MEHWPLYRRNRYRGVKVAEVEGRAGLFRGRYQRSQLQPEHVPMHGQLVGVSTLTNSTTPCVLAIAGGGGGAGSVGWQGGGSTTGSCSTADTSPSGGYGGNGSPTTTETWVVGTSEVTGPLTPGQNALDTAGGAYGGSSAPTGAYAAGQYLSTSAGGGSSPTGSGTALTRRSPCTRPAVVVAVTKVLEVASRRPNAPAVANPPGHSRCRARLRTR